MSDERLTPAMLTSDPSVIAVDFSRPLPDGRLQCTLCPRACHLLDGQRGLCWVRGRIGDGMVLTTWGRSSGFCIDPIEKKPLHHYLPGTPILSFGTAGCNLSCKFCQNWSISKARHEDVLADRGHPLAIADAAVRAGCPAVAMTYNDPVIFYEYARDVAAACRSKGLKTVAVTAGYLTDEAQEPFWRCFDAANVDLKAFTESFYRQQCGGHLQPVLETLKYLVHHTQVWTEITTLLIPGHNDSDEEVTQLAEWIATELGPHVPLHFSAFHPDFKMLHVPPTPAATLRRARAIAQKAGLQYVYIGNVHDAQGASTWCHGCGTLLIGRDWYEITAFRLEDGRCPECGAPCPGVWAHEAGHWGRKRQPVQVM